VNLPEPGSRCWIDGRPVAVERACLPAFDPGLLSGLGLFETLALRSARAIDLDAHLGRLQAAAGQLQIAMPPIERVRGIVEVAAATSPDACGWIKIVVTAAGHWLVARGRMVPQDEGRPASAVVLRFRRNPRDPLVGLKTLCYAPGVLGLREAMQRGADEGLWLNVRGRLAEGCASNLFVVRGGRLFTPSEREGILPGIVRRRTIEAARGLGLAVHEGPVRRERLARAGEAFLTSSLRGVRPLVRVGGRPVGSGATGPLTRRLAAEVARLRGVAEGVRA
jgi:branched-subunit amino acid aminotransferase/4-amino-4-deoxychorismate lyase